MLETGFAIIDLAFVVKFNGCLWIGKCTYGFGKFVQMHRHPLTNNWSPDPAEDMID